MMGSGGLLESALVALLVAAAAAFSTWRLLSTALRMRLILRLQALARALGHESAWLSRLQAATARKLAAGCAACTHRDPTGHRR